MSTSMQAQAKTALMSFMPAPAGLLQRKCACGQHTIGGGECTECQKAQLQRRAATQVEPAEVPAIVYEVLRSPGQPLDPTTRAFMEPRFGRDFSRVRVHTDARAAESALAVNALAYTVGQDIVFGVEQYTPETMAGKRLVAHELTHVVQQLGERNQPVASQVDAQLRTFSSPLAMGQPDDQYEQEADRLASKLMYPATEGIRDANLIQLRSAPQVIRRRQPNPPEPTKADLRQMHLRALAGRPGQALDQWKKLKQNERDIVVREMIANYGWDFAMDFLKYAKGEKKRPHFAATLSNSPNLTTQVLIAHGYRYAGDIGFTPIWVHPSGHEIWLPPSAKPGTSAGAAVPPGVPEGNVQEKCVDPCMEKTKDEEECKKCCEERIPAEDAKCRRACEFACSLKL